jgi:lipopolysaccharide export system protein LptC
MVEVKLPTAATAGDLTRPVAPPTQGITIPRLSGLSRYSLFVNSMKVFLPALAAALIILVVAWPQLVPDENSFQIEIIKNAAEQAKNLAMINAKYDGVDEEGRPFTVTADMATQLSDQRTQIELQLPKADMTLNDGTWLALNAKVGNYDRDAELLDLRGDVSLFHDRGFEMTTESAQVNLAEGTAQGDQAVEGHGPVGILRAEGFQVLDRGSRIIFTGQSQMIFFPEAREYRQ